MLSVGHEDGLMVGGSIDGAETVEAGRDALVDGHSHDSVTVSGGVNTLEECEGQGVKGLSGIGRRQRLDHDVSVPNDNALSIDLLGSGVVVALGIDKVTELHVADLHLNGESLVGLEARVGVLGKHKLGSGGYIEADDAAHWCRVARSGNHLLTIGKGDVLGQAKVDEIVLRGEGSDLAGIGVVALTVLRQTGGDYSRVERKRGLSICLTPVPGRTWDSKSGRSERKEGEEGLGHHCFLIDCTCERMCLK